MNPRSNTSHPFRCSHLNTESHLDLVSFAALDTPLGNRASYSACSTDSGVANERLRLADLSCLRLVDCCPRLTAAQILTMSGVMISTHGPEPHCTPACTWLLLWRSSPSRWCCPVSKTSMVAALGTAQCVPSCAHALPLFESASDWGSRLPLKN